MSGPPPLSYLPAPHERDYYGRLFQAADVHQTGAIAGGDAVQFFTRSKLSLEKLKHVWNLSDRPSTNALDPRKFAVAVRLIQLEQHQIPIPGPDLGQNVPPSLRPAYFEGIAPSLTPGSPRGPSLDPQHPPTSPQPQQQHFYPPRAPGGGASSVASSVQQLPPLQQQQPQQQLVVQDPYSMSPSEHARYEQLFPEYTQDEFMTGAQAVALFTKSGLETSILAQIWNLVDTPVDNKLDKLEFCLAMHLIVCISKKNLPVPTMMPLTLKQLKLQQQQLPSQTISIPTPQPGGFQQPPPPSMQQHQPPPPLSPPRMQQQQQPSMQQQQPLTMQPSSSVSFDGGIPSPTRGAHPVSSSFSGLPGPPPITSNTLGISDAFEGLNAHGFEGLNAHGDTGSIASYGATTPIPPPVTTVQEETVSRAPALPDLEPPPRSSKDLARSYDMGDAQVELDKLRGALQKLQAENISLKATLGTLSGEEKDIQKELSATIAEITTLSGQLTTLRAQVLASKSRLMEATAELKASKEKKGVLKDLIGEASATKAAIDDAYAGIEAANEQVLRAPAPAPAAEPNTDFFGGWGDDATPAPPIPRSVQAPAASPKISYTALPVAKEGAQEVVPRYEPTNFYNGGGYQHNRNASAGSEFGEVMGGAPSSNVSASFDSLPASPSLKEVDDLKARSREADDVARSAEDSRRQLTAQLEELRRLADEAEAKSRAAAEKPVKKGPFRRGANKKFDEKEAARLTLDAKDKKEAMLHVQAQVKDAEALAAETKTESERLRQEADDAQMKAATAASMQTRAGQDTVPPLPTFSTPPLTNGLGRLHASEPPSYSMIVAEVDNKPPAFSGGMGGFGSPPLTGFDKHVMGGGGLEIPTPSNDAYSSPFDNPFE